jgi:hypothetical protein
MAADTSSSRPGSGVSKPQPGQQGQQGQQGRPKGSANEATLQPSLMDDPAEAARNLAAQATSAAQSLSSDFQDAVKATTRAVQAQASEFGADVGHELSQVAEAQKIRGVEAMQGLARTANRAANELAQQSPTVARYVRDAAKQVEDLSSNIRGRSVTDLMHAATDLARSQPAVFFAGALAAGFALSRFLKSSAAEAEAMAADDSARQGARGTQGPRSNPQSGGSGQPRSSQQASGQRSSQPRSGQQG